ncbi:hypothetical protein [Blastococcus sp. SYSU D00695]
MHTGYQLREEMFAPTVDGAPATLHDVFPGWGQRDRFGIVVDSPIGGIGASLLIQLAVVAHFTTDPTRVGLAYPEIYTFHVGEFQGTHAQFDCFPPRKEVVVPDDPALILEAVNDRGITRLAVVDGPVEESRHHLQEPGQALNTLLSVFAYSPTGRVPGADVEITGVSPVVEENTSVIVDPDGTKDLQDRLVQRLRDNVTRPADGVLKMPRTDGPPAEVRLAAGRVRRATVGPEGQARETYRRVSVDDALGMLHRRGA